MKVLWKHKMWMLRVFISATMCLAIAAACMAQYDHGFNLVTQVRATPVDPWSSSVTVNMGEPVYVKFSIVRVSGGSSLETISLDPDDNLLNLAIGLQSSSDVLGLHSTESLSTCKTLEPRLWDVGETDTFETVLVERYDPLAESLYIVDGPGIYNLATSITSGNLGDLFISAAPVTIVVNAGGAPIQGINRHNILRHLAGFIHADEQSWQERLALEQEFAGIKSGRVIDLLRKNWQVVWPTKAPFDGVLVQKISRPLTEVMAAYLSRDLGKLEAMLSSNATYNVVIGKAEFLGLVPKLLTHVAIGSSWKLIDIQTSGAGQCDTIVQVTAPNGTIEQVWKLSWSVGKDTKVTAWRVQ